MVWYNNLDVVPFLETIGKQTVFYQQRGIDMFKDGISVPGLTLLYLFNDLPANTYFTLFNEKHKDLHRLVKVQIVGGPAIISHRYHEKDVTKVREVELGEAAQPCRSVVGYDASALYLWALMQDMPTGWFTHRREQNGFPHESSKLYGQMAAEWLTWVPQEPDTPSDTNSMAGRSAQENYPWMDGAGKQERRINSTGVSFTDAPVLGKR